ncbi:hypothetical protein F4823DRAFT_587657 [Ustulina deusta]|nr:hypothetical protein F4823DRAFT_587657 [Ustulina deusta]
MGFVILLLPVVKLTSQLLAQRWAHVAHQKHGESSITVVLVYAEVKEQQHANAGHGGQEHRRARVGCILPAISGLSLRRYPHESKAHPSAQPFPPLYYSEQASPTSLLSFPPTYLTPQAGWLEKAEPPLPNRPLLPCSSTSYC